MGIAPRPKAAAIAPSRNPHGLHELIESPRLMRIDENPHFAITGSPDPLAQFLHLDGPTRARVGARARPADDCRAFGAGRAVQGGHSHASPNVRA